MLHTVQVECARTTDKGLGGAKQRYDEKDGTRYHEVNASSNGNHNCTSMRAKKIAKLITKS